jgi:hypothetical protein
MLYRELIYLENQIKFIFLFLMPLNKVYLKFQFNFLFIMVFLLDLGT